MTGFRPEILLPVQIHIKLNDFPDELGRRAWREDGPPNHHDDTVDSDQ